MGAVLDLQRLAGNQATCEWLGVLPVQRCGPLACDCEGQEGKRSVTLQRLAPSRSASPTSRLPLSSPRFAGDSKLEACAQDRGRLATGARGGSVRSVQQALADLGYTIDVDGRYGPQTAAVVRTFKRDHRLGFEQFGDVGPGTIRRLDELFPAGPPKFCPFPRRDRDLPHDFNGDEGLEVPVQAVPDTEVMGDEDDCVDPPVPPSPVPPVPKPDIDPPKPDVDPKPDIDPPKPDVDPPTPPAPKPNFAKDAGCDVPIPALPVVPAPRPFAPDPARPLPKTETAPDLSEFRDSVDFWERADARAVAEKLADCYAARTKDKPKPVDRDDKFAKLAVDFSSVVAASFSRGPFGVPWQALRPRLAARLNEQRANIRRELENANDKRKKDERRTKEQLEADLEVRMQPVRHSQLEQVRQQVEIGVWGWMAERREKLDFDTIEQKKVGKEAKLADSLSETERQGIVHAILVDAKAELTNDARDQALAKARAAKGKRLVDDENARRRAAKEKPLTKDEASVLSESAKLTPDEESQTVAAAESAKLEQLVKAKKVSPGEKKRRVIEARSAKEQADLVVPTKKDLKGWNTSNTVPIHKDLLVALQALEKEFPAGFTGGTYQISVAGDHASGGFEGRFRSVDLYPNGGTKPTGVKAFDNRELGFFEQQVAFDFALAIDRVCNGRGTFQILYNDFAVAREVNKVMANGRMVNVDNVTENNNLNWHGPLVTHFHVDFAI